MWRLFVLIREGAELGECEHEALKRWTVLLGVDEFEGSVDAV